MRGSQPTADRRRTRGETSHDAPAEREFARKRALGALGVQYVAERAIGAREMYTDAGALVVAGGGGRVAVHMAGAADSYGLA